jgi:hypothetical protein
MQVFVVHSILIIKFLETLFHCSSTFWYGVHSTFLTLTHHNLVGKMFVVAVRSRLTKSEIPIITGRFVQFPLGCSQMRFLLCNEIFDFIPELQSCCSVQMTLVFVDLMCKSPSRKVTLQRSVQTRKRAFTKTIP